MNEDQTEMIGWPEPVATIRTMVADFGARLVVTGNYGEAARIDNAAGADNEERGGPVLVCAGPAAPWSEVWDRVAHLSA